MEGDCFGLSLALGYSYPFSSVYRLQNSACQAETKSSTPTFVLGLTLGDLVCQKVLRALGDGHATRGTLLYHGSGKQFALFVTSRFWTLKRPQAIDFYSSNNAF